MHLADICKLRMVDLFIRIAALWVKIFACGHYKNTKNRSVKSFSCQTYLQWSGFVSLAKFDIKYVLKKLGQKELLPTEKKSQEKLIFIKVKQRHLSDFNDIDIINKLIRMNLILCGKHQLFRKGFLMILDASQRDATSCKRPWVNLIATTSKCIWSEMQTEFQHKLVQFM